jgi:fructosamine-3-kinase
METFVTQALAELHLPMEKGISLSRCAGGDINDAFVCRTGSLSYFVKVHSGSKAMFTEEMNALIQLSETGLLTVPEPLGVYQGEYQSCLVMSFIAMKPLSEEGYFVAGQHLARCHEQTEARYGWPSNNFIGTTRQVNHWTGNWFEFFIEHRLQQQIDLLGDKEIASYRPRLDSLQVRFQDYQPPPSLLHGDLWSGNLAATDEGAPIFFDPASYYGDRETDLAMTELFGRFPSAFYRGYEAVWPMDSGYTLRKPIYQLYHILNHANLFGGGYVAQSRRMLSQLLG